MQIALAPMEGLVDEILRDVLTRVGGIDWCVTEFIRITDRLLPATAFHKLAPELRDGSRTRAGTPMRVQLLGSDPACLADNAAFACELGAPVIDLNFGCPAKTVNRSRGGAVLLKEPELMHDIVAAVRRAVPSEIAVTSKMRLGYDSPDGALDCARAPGRRRLGPCSGACPDQGRWLLGRRRTGSGWRGWPRRCACRCSPMAKCGRSTTTCVVARSAGWRTSCSVAAWSRVLAWLGRSPPGAMAAKIHEMPWSELLPLLRDFWLQARRKLAPRYAPGRLKQWLGMLTRTYPEAVELFARIRRESDCETIDRLLQVSFSQAA